MGPRRFGLRPPGSQASPIMRRWGRLPPLGDYADEPIYDLAMLADLLGVARMTLWAWVQELRIPRRSLEDGSPARPRFSERDLVALLWLRDQILGGASPFEAAALLIPELDASRAAVVEESPATALSTPGAANASDAASANLMPFTPSYPTGGMAPYPMGAPITPPPWVAGLSRPGVSAASAPPPDLAVLAEAMLRACEALDATAMTALAQQALDAYPIEDVCTRLLVPVLARIEHAGEAPEMATTQTLFARHHMRGLLLAQFVLSIERQDYPRVFLGCGPKEDDEIPALVLGIHWRRAGLRVAYLGPDVEAGQLARECAIHRPALLALCVSQPQRVRSLARLAREVAQVAGPDVLVGYYGPVFAEHPDLRARVDTQGGIYLGDDPDAATRLVRQRLLGSGVAPFA